MKLKMRINKVKSIEKLEIELPIHQGLYAITGQNGSGKSTIVTCASSVFFNMPMNDYFGKTDADASISFELGEAKRSWFKENSKWQSTKSGFMQIKGFYEGSLIFGNRFRNTSYELLRKLDEEDPANLVEADSFIKENLGRILHNNSGYYDKILNRKKSPTQKSRGDIFYYQKGTKRVSQFHMSTGENLLISVLNSINIRNKDRASLMKPCILFLDEIELALHPSSLKRLVIFLDEMSKKYNYAIYFSTHSIELISSIDPSNIFFIERHADDSIEILNPCYPAYATRILYDHNGYDYIFLVEDDLAKEIITRILKQEKLLSSKLIHVLPCGGYTNVIDLAHEVVNSNLLGKFSKASIILDGDVKDKACAYRESSKKSMNIPLNFLPIESLEKYLKENLYENVDHKLFRHLSDNIFHQKSLSEIINNYKISNVKNDKNGKALYSLIDEELRLRNIKRNELIEIIINYLFNNHTASLQKTVNFLRQQINNWNLD